ITNGLFGLMYSYLVTLIQQFSDKRLLILQGFLKGGKLELTDSRQPTNRQPSANDFMRNKLAIDCINLSLM
ncbi:MAG: hypothetical protein LBL79_14045, partial [Prevotella sp.]|nr:hypothetical protein [Prevotella sp.]